MHPAWLLWVPKRCQCLVLSFIVQGPRNPCLLREKETKSIFHNNEQTGLANAVGAGYVCVCGGGKYMCSLPFLLSGPLQSVILASETPCSADQRLTHFYLIPSLPPLWFDRQSTRSCWVPTWNVGSVNSTQQNLQIVCWLMYQGPWSSEETPQLQPRSLFWLRNVPNLSYKKMETS